MATYSTSPTAQDSDDTQIWDSLKEAIASSSGFESWQFEQELDEEDDTSLDYRVRRYLRETLETLAYWSDS